MENKTKEHTVEEDIRTQRLVNDIYEVLDNHKLKSIVVFDPGTKTLKEIDSLCINGDAMQLNSEEWIDDPESGRM